MYYYSTFCVNIFVLSNYSGSGYIIRLRMPMSAEYFFLHLLFSMRCHALVIGQNWLQCCVVTCFTDGSDLELGLQISGNIGDKCTSN